MSNFYFSSFRAWLIAYSFQKDSVSSSILLFIIELRAKLDRSACLSVETVKMGMIKYNLANN